VTFGSDQQFDLDKLSSTSRKMLMLREAVLAEWETRVRAAFQEAKELREPVFINTIPAFYDNLVEALTADYPRTTALDGTTLAIAHGGERARLTKYDPEELILEYQIFRLAILHVLERERITLTTAELVALNASIDQAIREAVSAFSAVIGTMREQFVAALTHDLRTPLSAASISAELITHLNDPARTKQLAKGILTHLTRMEQMIQQLLDTMVFQTGQRLRLDLSCFDILSVAQEVCGQMMPAAGARCEISGQSVQGWWDQDAMKRAIENLVGNALKYGSPRTPIRINIEQTHESLVLSVHNEGIPILLEEQKTVFQAFRRVGDATSNKKKGWGVGLPYVRSVAESHGGAITIDSASDRGTTFVITIPVDARPFQNAPTAS
jgi:signal transduction histidine kinase